MNQLYSKIPMIYQRLNNGRVNTIVQVLYGSGNLSLEFVSSLTSSGHS